jgi:adenylosuccinate synthase
VVKYATRVNGLTGLAVTKLDVLDTQEKVALCTSYDIDGELIEDFPADIGLLDRVRPVYEWLDGWRTPTNEARKLEDLPSQARAYLERIESLCDAPIEYVSVGTRRDQIIGLDAAGVAA